MSIFYDFLKVSNSRGLKASNSRELESGALILLTQNISQGMGWSFIGVQALGSGYFPALLVYA